MQTLTHVLLQLSLVTQQSSHQLSLSLSLFPSLSSDLSFHLDRLPGCEVDFTRVATQGFQMAIWPRLLPLSPFDAVLTLERIFISPFHPVLAMEHSSG